jgi:hypothetical protein
VFRVGGRHANTPNFKQSGHGARITVRTPPRLSVRAWGCSISMAWRVVDAAAASVGAAVYPAGLRRSKIINVI